MQCRTQFRLALRVFHNPGAYLANYVPRELDVARFSVDGADGEAKEVDVFTGGRHQVDPTVSIDSRQQRFVQFVRRLQE